MTTARVTSRRRIMRLAAVTAAGASIGACARGRPDASNSPNAASSNASGSLGLPYLFDADPPAQQLARRLLAAASNVKDMGTHERFMRLAIEQSNGNPSNPAGAVIIDHTSGEVLGQGVNRNSQNPMFHGEVVAINGLRVPSREHGLGQHHAIYDGRAVCDVLWYLGLGRYSTCGVGEFCCRPP